MNITFNKRFELLRREYDLPSDFSFHIDIPDYTQTILNGEILVTEEGITLEPICKGLYKAREKWENQSIIEDNLNHFHVDWDTEQPDNKKAFMLGIKTLLLLAGKFEEQDIRGIRFWYHFETPELTKQWAIAHNLHRSDDEEYYISDRLSFYTRREGEEVISINPEVDSVNAILIIDI